jgi:transaldolase
MNGWIANAHIKFPTIPSGLQAAHEAVSEGMRVNMTLVFTQEQAAAVYAATMGAKAGDVFVSPFVGRLDDKGIDGMSLIKNIITMYQPTDKHVSVLTASVRSLDHMVYAMAMGSDIITAPFSVLSAWADSGKVMPTSAYVYKKPNLKPVLYESISLDKPFASYNINHELTDAGLVRFMEDYQKLYQKK